MARYLKIGSCSGCPNKDHKGGFGPVAYIPICRAARRELPYEINYSTAQRRAIATPTGQIPNWCPLPELKG